MPELPDVQVYKEYVDSTALHKKVKEVDVPESRLLRAVSVRSLKSRMRRKRLVSTRRHGKNLFIRLEGDGYLRLHFGMTGRLDYQKRDKDASRNRGMEIGFTNGYSLFYVTRRKLGEIGLIDDVDVYLDEEGLGPDAMDPGFDAERLGQVLEGRRGAIKPALMNQSILAGLGNVYADEILLRAGIHPGTPVPRLKEKDLRKIHKAMRWVLDKAVQARVDPDRFPRSFILPDREDGAACPRCGMKLRRTKVSGRTTFFCPRDQRKRG